MRYNSKYEDLLDLYVEQSSILENDFYVDDDINFF